MKKKILSEIAGRSIRPVLKACAVMVLMAAICICTVVTGADKAEAATSLTPTGSDNLNISLRSFSELVVTDDGYMRIYVEDSQINIEYYDSSFNITSKKSVAMELDIWGGFYAGSDAYYVVEGQNNTDESDTAEVIRVIKYSTDWKKLGTAKITSNANLFGGEVRYPFDYGCVEMTEYDGKLYIVTGHEGYVDATYGQGHQGFLMIEVDESAMTGEIVMSDLWHSFAQYIESDGSDLYVLEQSEGSRATTLMKTDAGTLSSTTISVLEYGGSRTSAWAISCYASVDDMALSADNVLCVGTSIDQSQYDDVTSSTSHNIYLTVTPKSDFTEDATSVIWLTSFSGDGMGFNGVKLTKINDNRFLVTWEEWDSSGDYGELSDSNDLLSCYTLHYMFIDGSGNALTKEYTASAPISECQPVVNGSNVVYYASSGSMVNFYTINGQTGSFSKKSYCVTSGDASWTFSDGVLTFTGTGELVLDTETNYRYPLSACASWYSYSSSDNAWKKIRDDVTSVVIGSGITGICDSAFRYYDNLTSVTLPDSLKTIGDEAFYGCYYLRKITIPSSVTSIGEDVFKTGYYSTITGNALTFVTIYCEEGSTAYNYAVANDIKYVIVDENGNTVSDSTSSGSTSSGSTSSGSSSSGSSSSGSTGSGSTSSGTTSSGTTSSTSKLSAPTIKSIANKSSGVKITWGKVSGAVKYQVWRKTSSGSWTKLGTTTSTSYTDKTAKAGKTYSYRVRCVKSDGTTSASSYSSSKKIRRLTNGKITSLKNTSSGITVKWSKVTGASGYYVYRKTSSGSYKKIKTITSASTLSYKDTSSSLKNGTAYTYCVKPYYKSGSTVYKGSYNSKKTVRLKSVSLSSVKNSSSKKITVKWSKNSKATGYQIQYSTSKTFAKGNKTVTVSKASTLSKKIGSLKKGKTYYVRVRAYKKSGSTKYYSAWSSKKSVKVSK